ncbi:hypothetical protein BH10BAC2_BH10BAC2_49540 [soil metagenome]
MFDKGKFLGIKKDIDNRITEIDNLTELQDIIEFAGKTSNALNLYMKFKRHTTNLIDKIPY